MDYCRSNGVAASFHYIPLHSAPQGKKLGYKKSDLSVTESVSSQLLRFPLYAGMTRNEMKYIEKVVHEAMDQLTKKESKVKIEEEQYRNIRIPYLPISLQISFKIFPHIQFIR